MDLQSIVGKNNGAAAALDKQLVLAYLRNKRVQRLLDTGCASGDFTIKVAQLLKAKEIHGVEIVEKSYKVAVSKGITVAKKDLNKKLPYKDNYFDVILSIQNIEHLYFTDDYLQEMHRILKKKGLFFLTTTNLAAIHYRIMLLLGMQPICLHPSRYQVFPLKGKSPRYGHKSVFTFKALKEVLRKHNFKIVKSYTHSVYFLPRILSNLICKIWPNIGTFSCYLVKKI